MGGWAMGVKALPPWGVILLQLGACAEAIAWAAKRPVTAATLAACPSREWRIWLAQKTHTGCSAKWVTVHAALVRALSGSGDGSGSGSGYGDDYGSGSGYGYGDDYGSGYGYGDGYGEGDGSGSGDGDGSGVDIVKAT